LRRIPLSEHSIALGFFEFVNSSKRALFPDIPIGTYVKASSAFSRWWSKRVRSMGITIAQPAHAFRHSFKTEMRALGVADSISDAITGHAAKTESGRYGSVPLTTKKEAIDKLSRLDVIRVY
jgi:integrase